MTTLASAPNIIVWLPLAMEKDCVTVGAALNSKLPACAAAIVQVPTVTGVTNVPDTVQIDGVVDVNATGNPELADALNVTDPLPSTLSGMAPKVIVCRPTTTVNVCVNCGAGAKLPSPA